MSSSFVKGVTPSTENIDGSLLRIAIIHTRWNYEIVESLVRGAKETMISHYNVKPENIIVQSVSGSFELPFAAKSVIQSSTLFHAVICIGVLIKGSTMHFEYISEAVSQGIMRVGLDTNVPVIFGVLTCLNDDQALERAGLGNTQEKHNHGIDWGHCAVEMAHKNINWRNNIFK